MRPERARNIALAFGAALLLLWSAAATTVIRHTAPPVTLRSVTSTDAAAVPVDQHGATTDMVDSVLAFVREITRSLERGDYTGAVIRLLIIVEVLITALGAVSTITVHGKVKADLVYRIVDVMGALFLLIALLLLALTAGSLATPRR